MKLITQSALCLLALVAFNANADITKCVGMESDGSSIHVMVDSSSNTMNIEGEIYKIIAPTQDHKGISTEDYQTVKGHTVYDSLVFDKTDQTTAVFYQINDKTKDVIAQIPVACHKE